MYVQYVSNDVARGPVSYLILSKVIESGIM